MSRRRRRIGYESDSDDGSRVYGQLVEFQQQQVNAMEEFQYEQQRAQDQLCQMVLYNQAQYLMAEHNANSLTRQKMEEDHEKYLEEKRDALQEMKEKSESERRGRLIRENKNTSYHDSISSGITRFEQGNYQEALLYFNKALTARKTADIYYYIGACQYTLGQYKNAEKNLDTAINKERAKQTENADALNLRGILRMDKRNYEAALLDFNASLVIRPDNQIEIRARVAFISENYEDVCRLLKPFLTARQKIQKMVSRYLLYVEAAIKLSRTDEVMPILTQLLSALESSPSLVVTTAYINLILLNLSSHEDYFDAAKLLLPDLFNCTYAEYNTDPEALFRVLELCKNKTEENGFYYELYNHIKALPLLIKSDLLSEINQRDTLGNLTFQVEHDIWPEDKEKEYRKRKHDDKWNVLGYLYAQGEQREKSQQFARVCFEKAHDIDPSNRSVLYNLGITHAYHTDLETDEQKAKEFFDAADKAGDTDAKLQYLKCDMRIEKKNLNNAEHWNSLGVVYSKKEDSSTKINQSRRRLCYEKAVKCDEAHFYGHYNLAFSLKNHEQLEVDHDKAKLHFKKAIAIYEQTRATLSDKEQENRKGSYEKAVRAFLDYDIKDLPEKYRQRTDDNKWNVLGHLYAQGEQREKSQQFARVCFEKAHGIGPSNRSVLYNLGITHAYHTDLETDEQKAKEFFDAADKAGHENAKLQYLKCDMRIEKKDLNNARHWNSLGITLSKKEDSNTKINQSRRRLCYEQAVECDEAHFYGHYNLTKLAFVLKNHEQIGIDLDKAKMHFQKAIEIYENPETSRSDKKGYEETILSLLDCETKENAQLARHCLERYVGDCLNASGSFHTSCQKKNVFRLVEMCREGIGGEQDLESARKYYAYAEELGHTKVWDGEEDVENYQHAAGEGDCEAAFKYAEHLFSSGSEGKKEAFKYYEVAAPVSGEASYKLAEEYLRYGKYGVSKDTAAAKRYFQHALKLKQAEPSRWDHTAYYLACMCSDRSEYLEAKTLFLQVLNKQSEKYWKQESAFKVGMMYYTGKEGIPMSNHTAKRYFEDSTANSYSGKGYGPALFYLGKVYHYGYGVTKNSTKAADYLKQAMARNNDDARKFYNEHYSCAVM